MPEQAASVLVVVVSLALGAALIRYREAIGSAVDAAYRAFGSGVARFLRL